VCDLHSGDLSDGILDDLVGVGCGVGDLLGTGLLSEQVPEKGDVAVDVGPSVVAGEDTAGDA
jgi:hypothetical protein